MTSGVRDLLLLGLAENPAAPRDVLLRLLAPEAKVCWDAVCQDRALPPEVVEALLVHPDRELRRRLAANPHVEAGQRERLLGDPDPSVLIGLARSATVRWGHSLSDDAVRALLDTGYSCVWDALVHLDVRRRVIPIAVVHPLPAVRAHLCIHHVNELHRSERRALEADPDREVRRNLAETLANGRKDVIYYAQHAIRAPKYSGLLMFRPVPRKVIDLVLERDDPFEVRWLARNRYLPPDVVAVLTRHPSPRVRRQVGVRRDLTAEQLAALITDPDVSVRTAASVNPALTEERRMAVDFEVAADGNFPPDRMMHSAFDIDVVLRWAQSAHPMLRRWAACDVRLPADVVERFATDDDLGVRVLLAHHHPDAPPQLLLRCYLEYTGSHRWDLVTRPGFPTTGLARYATDPDPMLRRIAALDPQLRPHLADALTRDPDDEVRNLGARSPQLPPERLRELLTDPKLARAAAANPALAPQDIHELLDRLEIPVH